MTQPPDSRDRQRPEQATVGPDRAAHFGSHSQKSENSAEDSKSIAPRPGALPGVCLLTETYHPIVGGGETQARAIAEGLSARGWPVFVVCRRSDPGLARLERLNGVDIYRVPPAGGWHLSKWMLLFTTLPTLIRRRRHYDLLLICGFRILGIPALLAARAMGKVCVLKADSRGEMSGEYFSAGLERLRLGPRFPLFRLFLCVRNRLFSRADAFVATSTEIANELAIEGVSPAAIERIPNGVDTTRFRPTANEEKSLLRQRLGLPTDRKIVVYTGRLVSYKGLPWLLETWRQMRSEHPDTLLLLVGGGSLDIHNCEEELKRFVQEHALGDSVVFAGEVGNVHEFLQAADVFVFPTENEAFGISLVEAMACALPVVSTRVGGIGDVLRHEENGLCVAVGASAELSRALGSLLTNPGLGERLGEAARQDAVEDYSVERTVGRYASLAERLLRRKATGISQAQGP